MRVAVQRHTWAEIGAALGVSRQAAHQKFAKEWAETLKDELKAEQRDVQDRACATGDADAAGAAEAQARRARRRAQGREPPLEVARGRRQPLMRTAPM